MQYRTLVAKIANWDSPLSVFEIVFIIRTMKENLVATIAAISVPTGTGSGGWPVYLRKPFLENQDSSSRIHFSSPLHDSGLPTINTLMKRRALLSP